MQGAIELSARGIRSSLFEENRSLAPNLARGPEADLLFDPQTAGGLLAAVSADAADGLLEQLRSEGYPAAKIGGLSDGLPGLTLV